MFVRKSDICCHQNSLKPEMFTFSFSVVSHDREGRAPAWVKMIMLDILSCEVEIYRRDTLPKKKL